MHRLIRVFFIVLFCLFFSGIVFPNIKSSEDKNIKKGYYAQSTCYFQSEEVRGNIKMCYYSCGGAIIYRTVSVFTSCPFSITVN
jgi:hypothetical protein